MIYEDVFVSVHHYCSLYTAWHQCHITDQWCIHYDFTRHHCVDLTETTGVMRLLVVSMALTKDKNSVVLPQLEVAHVSWQPQHTAISTHLKPVLTYRIDLGPQCAWTRRVRWRWVSAYSKVYAHWRTHSHTFTQACTHTCTLTCTYTCTFAYTCTRSRKLSQHKNNLVSCAHASSPVWLACVKHTYLYIQSTSKIVHIYLTEQTLRQISSPTRGRARSWRPTWQGRRGENIHAHTISLIHTRTHTLATPTRACALGDPLWICCYIMLQIMSDEDKLKNQRDLLWRSPIGFKHQVQTNIFPVV